VRMTAGVRGGVSSWAALRPLPLTNAPALPAPRALARPVAWLPLGVALILYAVSGSLATGEPPEHVHTALDLLRKAGAWSVVAVPALVAARALGVAAAVDMAGALGGWGVRYGMRLRAVLVAEVVFAAACLLHAVAVYTDPAAPPPLSLAALLDAHPGAGREWVHALPQMIGLDDLAYVVVLGMAWSRLEQRPALRALALAAAAYGGAAALVLGVLLLGAL